MLPDQPEKEPDQPEKEPDQPEKEPDQPEKEMVTDRTALVTGANGFIGSHLVDRLLGAGWRVRAMVRRSGDPRWLAPEAERVYADVTDAPGLPPAVTGVDVVFHVAGVVAAHRARRYEEVNVLGTRSLLAACRKACPDLHRFVLVSSLAAGGPSPRGRPRREWDPPRPVSVYGRSKLGGERVVEGQAGAIPYSIVRPPVVYGPRDTDMLNFFELVARGYTLGFRRRKYNSIIHASDLVRGIVAVAEEDAAVGRTYHLADAKAWSMDALLGEMAEALGKRTRRIPVPEPLLRLVGGPVDAILPAIGLAARPVADKVRELLPDFWVADTSRAREDLGFATEVPLREGIRETAAFYREQGLL